MGEEVMFGGGLMTLDHQINWDGAVYGIVSEDSTELMLQPYANRRKVMSTAWMGMLGFVLMVLPFTILPTFLVTIFGLIILSGVAPGAQNSWFALGAVLLLWSGAFMAIVWLIWQAIADSGYKTFIFDRQQRELVINTATIIGRKVTKIIPFNQIRDTQFYEAQHDGISMQVLLVLDDWQILGMTHPNKIVLSAFANVSSAITVQTLIASKHHQELLLAVRSAMGLSTHEIAAQVQRIPAIPTAAELKQQQTQAIADATESLNKIAKLTFASKSTKSANLETLRSQTRLEPDNPQVWEEFALALSLQPDPPTDEVVNAYRRAEALYLDRGSGIKAATIAQVVKNTKYFNKSR
jgi:hypothetical protein